MYGIFHTYIYHKSQTNVGMKIPYMDGMRAVCNRMYPNGSDIPNHGSSLFEALNNSTDGTMLKQVGSYRQCMVQNDEILLLCKGEGKSPDKVKTKRAEYYEDKKASKQETGNAGNLTT